MENTVSRGGKNRRFYRTEKYGFWSLPIQTALDLIEELRIKEDWMMRFSMLENLGIMKLYALTNLSI